MEAGLVNVWSGLTSACLGCQARGLSPPPMSRDKHDRFPAESIRHGVWLEERFCLGYRQVEKLLFVRGVIVSYQAMRPGC